MVLCEFRQDDWPAILGYQTNPRHLRYYDHTRRTPEQVQAFVRMFLDQQQAHPRIKFQLAVTLQDTRQLIGTCGIRLDAPGAHEGDIGYELNPEHWGQGYATEAARAIVRFGFVELGLHRVGSWCIANPTLSAMRLEGRQLDKEHFKGRWWDRLLYAILEDEWRARGRVRDNATTS